MLIAPDVSYYQKKVDSTFNRQWLIFRCCDGSFFDPNASFNADWSRGAVAQGKLKGWTTYVVYRPGQNAAIMANLAKIAPLDRVMIDVETWRDPKTGIKAISGDHSAEINQLATLIAAKTSQARTWIYYNHGDGAEVAPHHYDWLSVVIAGYQATRPALPGPGNLIGWQYTNGVENHTANPSSTPPFGACDHNELYVDGIDPAGGGTPITGGFMAGLTDQQQIDLYTDQQQDHYAIQEQIAPAVASIRVTVNSLMAIAGQPVVVTPGVDEAALAADLAANLTKSLPPAVVAELVRVLTEGAAS